MPAGQDTIATDVAALKVYYKKDQVLNTTILRINQLFAMTPKNTDFSGKEMPVPIMSSGSPGISTDYATALANIQAGVYQAFAIPTLPIFNLAAVSNQARKASRDTVGGFKPLLQAQTDACMMQCTNFMAAYQYRDGTGTLGQADGTALSTAGGPAAGVITLKNQTDAQFWFKGLKVTASANPGDTPRGSQFFITAVDVVTGQLTFSAVQSGPPVNFSTTGDWQASDYLQLAGTFNMVPPGLQKWLPISAATYPGPNQPPSVNEFQGVKRGVDASSYAGTFFNGAGMKVRDALVRGLSQIINNGGSPTLIMTNPQSLAELDLELAGQYTYTEVRGPTGISFEALKLMTPFGPLPILSDRNCPPYSAWALDMAELEIFSMGECPGMMDFGDNTVFYSIEQDNVIAKIGAYWNFYIARPRSCGAIALGA